MVRKDLIAKALVAAPGIVFAFLAFHGAWSDYRYMEHVQRLAEARTASTVGAILEAHDLVARNGHVTPQGAGIIGFTTESGREVRVPYRGFSAKPGSRIAVRYNPDDPENCSIGTALFGWADLFWGNAPLLVLSFMFLIPAILIGRRKD
jgi:hypothetical protein